MVKTLQMSGLPGSFRVTRAGSVAAGLSFSQMVSGESKRAIVLPRLFDILAWPSSPRTRFAVESRACGSGSENPFANRVFQRRGGSRLRPRGWGGGFGLGEGRGGGEGGYWWWPGPLKKKTKRSI